MLYVFGNESIDGDSFALDVARAMNVEFRHLRSPELLLEAEGHITILDVVRGITEPTRIDVSQLKTRGLVSLHDFDVGYFLTLLDRLGMLDSITIIGIPQRGDAAKIAHEVSQWTELASA